MKVKMKLAMAAAAAAFVVFCGWVAATAQVSMPHPRAAGVRLFKTPGGGLKVEATERRSARAIASETKFDFGVMDPETIAKHTFVVRNDGAAALTLEKGPTTCKCTLSEASREPIPPGGEGSVTLEWNTGRKNRAFLQTADVYSNDPKQRRLRFQVTGLVRMNLGAEPWEIVVADLPPDRSGAAETVIYSQIHESFTVVGGESSLEGMTWRVEPVDDAAREAFNALSACRVIAELPAGMPSGHFSATLRLNIEVGGAPEAEAGEGELPARRASEGAGMEVRASEADRKNEVVELSVVGKVLRRMSIYGAGIDGDGVVDMGIVSAGEAKKLRLLMKIYDPEPQLEFEPFEVEPKFLKVKVTPHRGSGDSRGLYQLEIESPADAPSCYYAAPKYGRIRLKPKHPRVEETTLKVNLAVTNR